MLDFTDWRFPKKNVKHVKNQSFQPLAKSRGRQLVAKTIGLQLVVAINLGPLSFQTRSVLSIQQEDPLPDPLISSSHCS